MSLSEPIKVRKKTRRRNVSEHVKMGVVLHGMDPAAKKLSVVVLSMGFRRVRYKPAKRKERTP